MGRTTISVAEETADQLHELKGRGESYDDVIQRLLQADGPGERDEPTDVVDAVNAAIEDSEE